MSTALPPFPTIAGTTFAHVPDWPGYAASDDGRVWTCKVPRGVKGYSGRHGGYLDTWVEKRPYTFIRGASADTYKTRQICLKGGLHTKSRCFSVHQIIMLAFRGPTPAGLEICHFPDHSTTNNRLDNLVFGTRQDNNGHKHIHGTIIKGESHPHSKLTDDDIREIRLQSQQGRTQFAIAKKFGLAQSTVSQIVNRSLWKHIR